MTFRAILFDLYDTLIYFDPKNIAEMNMRFAAKAGLSVEEWMRCWRSTGDKSGRGEIKNMEERVRLSLGAAGIPNLTEELIQDIASDRLAEMLNAPKKYPDVDECLNSLKTQGFKLALISDIHAYETAILDRFDMRKFFDAIILSCEMGASKPEPRMYLTAVEHLQVSPEECIFIGDGNGRQLTGARSLGMTSVRIDRDIKWTESLQDSSFDARVKTLPEFVTWLNGRNKAPSQSEVL